jgi:hypothetical protein
MGAPTWWQAMFSFRFGRRRMSWEPEEPPDLVLTAPPRQTHDGLFECSGCDAVVAWSDLAIDERGYLCPGCARVL